MQLRFAAFLLYASLLAVVGAAPCGISVVYPIGVSPAADYANITLFGARPGHRVFVMLPNEEYDTTVFNCTKPPTFETRRRTPEAVVRVFGSVLLYVRDLVPGRYIICYRNTTEDITNASFTRQPRHTNDTLRSNHTIKVNGTNTTYERRQYIAKTHIHRVYYERMRLYGFVQLLPVLYVADKRIDAERSSVCCHGPLVAGLPVACSITALDGEGRITGTKDDECRFNLCPLKDGSGASISPELITMPYFVKTGEFRFRFIPLGSGCAGVAGVGFDGMSLSNRYAFFKVQPNPNINVSLATSECTVRDHATTDSMCVITQRDIYGNPVKKCEVDPDGPANCYEITY